MFSKQRGFTIMEMLVVIAVISIISGFMVVNFRKGEEGGKLPRSAQLVVQGIRKAQSMALSTTVYEGDVYNYGVHFNKSGLPASYEIFADKNDNKRYNSSNEVILPAVILEKGIKIEALSTGNLLDIVFVPPDPSTILNNNPDISDITITIKREGGTCPGDCLYIKVNNKGWMAIEETP